MMVLDVNKLYNRRNDSRFNRMAVGDMTERLRLSRPDQPALIAWTGAYAYEENQVLTYQTLDSRANQFAHALLKRGLKRGDRVAFLMENSSEAFIAKLGVAKAGLVSVPINTMLAPDVVKYIIDLTKPAFIVSDDCYLSSLEGLLKENDGLVDLVLPIDPPEAAGRDGLQAQDFRSFYCNESSDAPEVTIHADDIWEILFTSGTTSKPKGAMISHVYTYLAGYDYGMHFSRVIDFPSQFKLLSFLPTVYHVADQTLPAACFLHGGSLMLGRRQNIKEMAEAISSLRPTALWGGSAIAVEELVDEYVTQAEKYDFSSLTSILYGYAVLDPFYHKKLKEICSDRLQIWNSFAQTEVIAGYRFYHDEYPDTYLQEAPLTNNVGHADAILASKIVDAQGETIHSDEVGEVVYRSPLSFSGYYKNQEATNQALVDGWFHSADGLYRKDNGLSVMVGRFKDIIKTAGENVSASRVEAVLNGHPSIKQAAVIGLSDPRWGEAVTAVVELREGESLTAEEVKKYARQHLAGFETPKAVYFEERLPESISNKIQKNKLIEKYENIKNKGEQ